MFKKIFSNFNAPNQRILNIYEYVTENKNSKFWESNGNLKLHSLLIKLSENDWKSLISDFENWEESEQNIISDCVAYGIDGAFNPPYTNEQRIVAQELYSKMQKGFSHPEFKKWKKNHKIHSKTKSRNSKVLSIYDYILQHEYTDSDFWAFGGGSQEIQKKLNNFTEHDWENLKQDIINWSEDDVDILIHSVAFGYDRMFISFLDNKMIPNASKFLLDLFILNIGDRHEIAYFTSFITQSEINHIEDLKTLKNWLITNGFDSEIWSKSEFSPLRNIEIAIEKASK